MAKPGGTQEKPALFFDGPEDFRAWLQANHETAPELWMGLYKRHVSSRGLTYEQAVPEALCYGWIDSVVQRIDEDANRQRWTPRRRGSVWSNLNVALVERLIAEGRMQPVGPGRLRGATGRPGGDLLVRAGRDRPVPAGVCRPARGRAAGCRLLGGGDAVLPQDVRVLGALGQAGRDPRPADGAAGGRLRGRAADQADALRRRAGLGSAGA